MAHAMRFLLLALVCTGVVLQPASAYNFNFGGGGPFSGKLNVERCCALAALRGLQHHHALPCAVVSGVAVLWLRCSATAAQYLLQRHH